MTSRARLGLLAAALCLAGCPAGHRPGPYDPYANLPVEGAPLPEGREALLAEADHALEDGPEPARLRRSLRAANLVLVDAPDDEAAAWRAARALYFLSTMDADGGARARLAAHCMDAAQVGMASGASAPAHYWGALCMGARAQAKNLEAIDLLPQMVELARRALALDPTVEHAGPNRVLGGIYLRAPAWPTSVGDLDEALDNLERAAELDAAWPENRFMFAEALAKDDRHDEARAQLAAAKAALQAPAMKRWADLWKKDLARVQDAVDDD